MSRRDEYQFVAQLQRELPGLTSSAVTGIAMTLMRLGASRARLAEHDCNVGLDDRGKRKLANIDNRIVALLANTKIKANLGGDPRGHTVKLILPSGTHNTWGGAEDGYAVPRS
jgi:hypothetical protein